MDEKVFDVFISYASEDREAVALPLKKALEAKGLEVWVDWEQMPPNTGLFRTIGDGLLRARIVLAILSPRYFEADWAQQEAGGAVALEADGFERLFPVLYDLTPKQLVRKQPLLADRICALESDGHDRIVDQILERLRNSVQTGPFDSDPGPDAPPRRTTRWVTVTAVLALLGAAAFLVQQLLESSWSTHEKPDPTRAALAIEGEESRTPQKVEVPDPIEPPIPTATVESGEDSETAAEDTDAVADLGEESASDSAEQRNERPDTAPDDTTAEPAPPARFELTLRDDFVLTFDAEQDGAISDEVSITRLTGRAAGDVLIWQVTEAVEKRSAELAAKKTGRSLRLPSSTELWPVLPSAERERRFLVSGCPDSLRMFVFRPSDVESRTLLQDDPTAGTSSWDISEPWKGLTLRLVLEIEAQ